MNKLSWITISASLLSSLSATANTKIEVLSDKQASHSESSVNAPSTLNKSIKKIQLNKKPLFAGVNCCVKGKA